MTDTTQRLCGRVDGATACATTCWRASVLDDEPCRAIEPGAGCGTGSDGLPCSPAYLCPSCIALLTGPEDGREYSAQELLDGRGL